METIPAFYFDDAELQRLAERHRDSFQNARPCPHVVIDDFLPLEILDRLIAEFPPPSDPGWEISGAGRTQFSRDRESVKLARTEAHFPPLSRHVLSQLNSAAVLRFLERLTGRKELIVDPTFAGCGMHSTGRGGRLMLHTDTNRHPIVGGRIHQVLNLMIYLNRDWRDDYGGHFELWEKSPRRCVTRVAPLANRCVVFQTGTGALHGHPEPVAGPEGQRRNSLAVYYYMLDRPEDDDYDQFQIDVSWYPTSEEDVRFAQVSVALFRGAIAEYRGRAVAFQVARLPAAVRARLPLGENPTLRLFDWDELSDREKFVETHLRAFLASRPDALARLRPFGLLADTITCLVDDEAKVFLCTGPDAPRLLWIGYVGRFLKLIE